MISRRQILRSGSAGPTSGEHQLQQHSSGASSASSGGSKPAGPKLSSQRHMGAPGPAAEPQQQQGRRQLADGRPGAAAKALGRQQQQDSSSDGYVATGAASSLAAYDDYASWRRASDLHQRQRARRQPALPPPPPGAGQQQQYRAFDPYSIYSDEADVWYSEERLFEDHLDEIYNKWPLLDDDIWCKLIVMERNRRIGKAYARVPIVTIDGSHELSYDGYKLALNGFNNPDRDADTAECRKRIGKGIRIKMDNFGNILIKRLSKSGIYIKEYINPALLLNGDSRSGSSAYQTGAACSNGIGGNGGLIGTNGSNINGSRAMPSRQQLIKNQNALLAAAMSGEAGRLGSSQISSLTNSTGTPTSSSSGGSSMEPSNDSALCDDVLSVGGRLDLDKIYVMFDMKKFQANITQELCRPYPDRRKLEQQCFSIIGLSHDSDDILNLPCWIMVINIVAVEMLNERFPMLSDDDQHQDVGFDYPDTILSDPTSSSTAGCLTRRCNGSGAAQATPNFVSIFDHPSANHVKNNDHQLHSKEEDPYSMPANASSTDVKSSINDYGTTSTKNMSTLMESTNVTNASGGGRHYTPSRYYCASKAYPRKGEMMMATASSRLHQQSTDITRHRSRGNYDIYGPGCRMLPNGRHAMESGGGGSERYNNSSSIYSPGHMLVPPSGDSKPPKLPPRDFVKKSKSKSSSNIGDPSVSSRFDHVDDYDENIYSTEANNLEMAAPKGASQATGQQVDAKVARKAKKNRFLESLKAPLELAKSSRSASVLGAPSSGLAQQSKLKQAAHEQSSSSVSALVDQPQKQQQVSGKKASTTTSPTSASNGGGKSKSTGGFTKTSAKNLKSLLGVGSKTTSSSKATTISDEGNYLHVNSDKSKRSKDSGEVDSVVDSNEEIDDSQPIVTTNSASCSSAAASYNDLDIPTPDYETDENIYAIEELSNGCAGATNFITGNQNNNNNRGRRHSLSQKPNDMTGFRSGGKSLTGASSNGKSTKDDLYYSGYRAHIPRNTTPSATRSDRLLIQQQQNGKLLHGSAACGGDDRMSCNSQLTREPSNRYLMPTNSRIVPSRLSGRDMIYGSTTGLPPATGCGNSQATGSRYRSASMQRLYTRTGHVSSSAASAYRSHNEMYDLEMENPYAMSGGTTCGQLIVDDPQGHYGIMAPMSTTTGHRRRSGSKLMNASDPYGCVGVSNGRHTSSTMTGHQNYDIGRSSSGIYGGHSGSSSSDYADCYPQLRKVNSSGYLNSVFKHHHQLNNNNNSTAMQVDSNIKANNPINSNTGPYSAGKSTNHQVAHGYNNNNHNHNTKAGATGRNHNTPQNLKSMKGSSKKQQPHNHVQQITTVDMNSSAYPIYDSSNESEPSYTNSSDGLDIYDQIGANSRLDRHQFLNHAHNLAPEVHVGEWENLYDR